MFQKIAKHRANDASNDVHRPPLIAEHIFSFDIQLTLEEALAEMATKLWVILIPIPTFFQTQFHTMHIFQKLFPLG